MSPLAIFVLLLVGSYLLGSIPFGYLVARRKGIDIFAAGSGNLGATNVGRVLGRKWGIAVFVLDFLKGALPVGTAKYVVAHNVDFADWQFLPNLAAVGCAVCTFLGHIFPLYIGFRGGKGVATGAGTILVLIPGPACLAFLVWIVALTSWSMVSLASLFAMLAFCVGFTVNAHGQPFLPQNLLVALYLYVGSALVIVKHRTNIRRLLTGTENRMDPSPFRDRLGFGIHLLALGWIVGATLFLQFIAGLSVFQTFPEVVANAPSDRTAQIAIAAGLNDEQKQKLASALAGSAIGPMFPPYFLWSSIAAGVALLGSYSRWHQKRLMRTRCILLALTFGLIVLNWLIAGEVSRLRLERFSDDSVIALQAKNSFASWHLASLLLSMLTCSISAVAHFLAGWMVGPRVSELGGSSNV